MASTRRNATIQLKLKRLHSVIIQWPFSDHSVTIYSSNFLFLNSFICKSLSYLICAVLDICKSCFASTSSHCSCAVEFCNSNDASFCILNLLRLRLMRGRHHNLYGKQMVMMAFPYSEFQHNAYLMIKHFKLIILDHPTATPVIPGRSIRTRHKARDRKTGLRSSDSQCSPVVPYLRSPTPVREAISLSWENISSYTVPCYILMWYSNSLTKNKNAAFI